MRCRGRDSNPYVPAGDPDFKRGNPLGRGRSQFAQTAWLRGLPLSGLPLLGRLCQPVLTRFLTRLSFTRARARHLTSCKLPLRWRPMRRQGAGSARHASISTRTSLAAFVRRISGLSRKHSAASSGHIRREPSRS